MSLHISPVDILVPEALPSGRSFPHTVLPPTSGPELDREVERRVFAGAPRRSVPPFSTEDWTATALAELVSRQTGWTCEVTEQNDAWSAMWIEHPDPSPAPPARCKILSMVTASGPTRALAICRSLVKATRCPGWPGVSRPGGFDLPGLPAPEPEMGAGPRRRH
ncbi:MAG: hypothetical protein LC796_11565 [Acidobacteria bacterium]|nr:hypothetical protein [Acidobacteriota bacterium]MCA1612451.1 hypothetical protein [Acidobacteriota bacterium]MCA1617465.1 hypothetical protein [Acidobacteriota bacterium]